MHSATLTLQILLWKSRAIALFQRYDSEFPESIKAIIDLFFSCSASDNFWFGPSCWHGWIPCTYTSWYRYKISDRDWFLMDSWRHTVFGSKTFNLAGAISFKVPSEAQAWAIELFSGSLHLSLCPESRDASHFDVGWVGTVLQVDSSEWKTYA